MSIVSGHQANRQLTRHDRLGCVHWLFEAQVHNFGQSLALVWEGQSITYEALNIRANQLAHYLMQRGVGPEVRVGLLLERSPELIVSLLGVLKAGGAYVPLDPNYPEERLRMILNEAELALVLTQRSSPGKLGTSASLEICIDREREAINEYSSENPDSGVQPEHLAYVIYTSGSTGKPKGVMIGHRGLCNMSAAQMHTFHVVPGDRVLQFASINFDASIFEMTMALCAGAALCLASREVQVSTALLSKLLKESSITSVTLPPSILAACEAQDLPDLQTIVVAGEACSARLVANWAPGRKFFNAYGPTETTVWASVARCMDGEVKPMIGRPIENAQIYILDEGLAPVSTNVIGDLYIGGAGLARGYLKSPSLTAERFVPNPFSELPGERLYYTGDLARQLPDGQIDFVGRRDQQIKLRGFRIELGDIEAALNQHSSVQENAVLLREDQPGEERLVAYVVLKSSPEISNNDLRSFLKTKLPDYMVPAMVVEVRTFPRMPNGKIDRSALPAPEGIRAEMNQPYVPPRNPLEEMVAGVWSDLLGIDRVGVHDKLFELGAHSLMLTRAAARLRDQFSVEIPLQYFFDSPTVATLAAALEKNVQRGQEFNLKPIMRAYRDSDLPLSFAQARVLFLQQLYGTNKAYNAQVSVSFKGGLDVNALEQSLNELVRRHEILRTTFPQKDGRAVQLIHRPEPRRLQVIDLASLPVELRQNRLNALMREEMDRTFDVEKLPLIRWTLFCLGPKEHLLLQVEHHCLHDGWSFTVLLRELLQIYKTFSNGLPSSLEEPAIQFADFAIWQQEFMEEQMAETQLAYWKRKLVGAPALLPLPTDFPRPAAPSFRGKALRIEVPAELSLSLKQLSRRAGCTLYMTMLAAFLALLRRYTDQDDLCVGTGLANRRWKETEGLLGMIINTVALRAELAGDPSFEELLCRVREVTIEAYANQDIPFDRVIEAIQPERSLSYSPLYQVAFSFHDAPVVDVDLPELDIKIVEALSNESSKFDLNVVTIPDARQPYRRNYESEAPGMPMIWEYSTDLFREDTIARLITHYKNLLTAIVSNPRRRISELPLLSNEEKQQLHDWNNTALDYPTRHVAEMLAAQAEQRPKALAVEDERQRWSYEELDRRSNQLAHYLRGLGIGLESRVGLLLPRSCEFVQAALAVIKAGGVYVPLDPQHPGERIRFMLGDVGASVVLTEDGLANAVVGSAAKMVLLDSDRAEIGAAASTPLKVEVSKDNLAYIIYTSGSTGQPKGVGVSHGGVMNLVAWHRKTYAVTDKDRASQVAGQSFDASVWEIWPYLTAGASLHIAPPSTVAVAAAMLNWLVEKEISITFLPTPLAEAVLKEQWPEKSSLRYLLTGGDWLHGRPPGKMQFELVNHYGPTENTVVATSARVEAVDTGRRPTIGRPIANTEVYILDDTLQPVPVGVAGEMYLNGLGLSRGYWQQPSLTAERFMPNPFCDRLGERMYRTGDLARYLANGELEFLGRRDGQVKLRGYRIELGEIEARLREHEDVQEGVAELRQGKDEDARLVAYVVLKESCGEESIGRIRSYLREHLPEYMVPGMFVRLDQLPRTPNGKVDRRALPEAELRTEVEPDFVPPRNKDEEVVANIWAEVLGLSKVGVTDNFFDLGGHSLLATRIVARVSNALQVEVPVDCLFRGGTVTTLVDAAQDRKANKQDVPVPISTYKERSHEPTPEQSRSFV
jgi:amino acid adenylation domain-containing protein